MSRVTAVHVSSALKTWSWFLMTTRENKATGQGGVPPGAISILTWVRPWVQKVANNCQPKFLLHTGIRDHGRLPSVPQQEMQLPPCWNQLPPVGGRANVGVEFLHGHPKPQTATQWH